MPPVVPPPGTPEHAGLRQALELSREMLDAAQALAWERVVELEAAREPLVLREHGSDETTRSLLGELLAIDRQLQACVRQARDDAAGQWQEETGRARAIIAYGQP